MLNRLLAPAALAFAVLSPATANAASITFDFNQAASSFSVTSSPDTCFTGPGTCTVSGSLVSFPDITVNEGSSATFNFGLLTFNNGFGSDGDGVINASLAFFSPVAGPATGAGNLTYVNAVGLFNATDIDWTTPAQSFVTALGTFTVKFLDTGIVPASGNTAFAPVTITVDSVPVAPVPEPATWAMMMLGFGAVGFAMRRRNKVRTTVSYA
jgi:hypothetical protein